MGLLESPPTDQAARQWEEDVVVARTPGHRWDPVDEGEGLGNVADVHCGGDGLTVRSPDGSRSTSFIALRLATPL